MVRYFLKKYSFPCWDETSLHLAVGVWRGLTSLWDHFPSSTSLEMTTKPFFHINSLSFIILKEGFLLSQFTQNDFFFLLLSNMKSLKCVWLFIISLLSFNLLPWYFNFFSAFHSCSRCRSIFQLTAFLEAMSV